MAHVTLVALGWESVGAARVDSFRDGLSQAGHVVELLAMMQEGPAPGSRRVPGLADTAVRGLRSASGDLVLLVDFQRPYSVEDASAVAQPVLDGRADIAVGCPGRPVFSARVLAPLARTTDPWSGLVAIRREVFARAGGRVRPVGERFALEIVQRIEGARLDVELPDRDGDEPRGWHLDDIRHLKRLADDRLGILSRLLQFCVVGASGMIVDLTCYAALQWELALTPLAGKTLPVLGVSLDLAVAGVLSVLVALLWNFSLNRRLTFNDARRSSVVGQFITYALSNALGVTISLSLRLLLPKWFDFFDSHKLAAAVVGIVASTGISFTMARWLVFPNQSKGRQSQTTPSDDPSSESNGALNGSEHRDAEAAAAMTKPLARDSG
ncbi:MAG: GtrA family protein [Isosphaeraceae bacterium]|nr:GtrA family protein [Isosphaeraceae bacterium]